MQATGALEGIRIIDLATARGELAGRVLADLGAEVIKIEPPGGAEARRRAPFVAGREGDPEASLYWASVALGKRSVVLDGLPTDRGPFLKMPSGAGFAEAVAQQRGLRRTGAPSSPSTPRGEPPSHQGALCGGHESRPAQHSSLRGSD